MVCIWLLHRQDPLFALRISDIRILREVETCNHGVAGSFRVVTVEIPFFFKIGREYDAEQTTLSAAAYPVRNVGERLLSDLAVL